MDAPARLPRPPVLVLGIALLAVRAVTLVLGQLSGQAAPTLWQISMAELYFAGEALLLVGALLVAWKLAPPLRVAISLFACLVIPSILFLGLIDFFLFTITGDHLTPSVLRQFVGIRLFRSHSFWEPVRGNAAGISLALMAVFALYAAASWLFWSRGRRARMADIRWGEVAAICGVGAVLFSIPARLTGYEEIERPVEVVYLEELLGYDRVRLVSERESVDSLRRFFGLPPGRVWLDERYPLVHGPDPALPPPPPMEDRPDVIVLVIESLRASCLPIFNRLAESDGCETPHLARLAEESVVLPRYVSNGFPSGEGFIAMTASVWPHHRRRITADYPGVHFDALPLRLADAGYFTFAAESSADFDNGGPWFDRFFEHRIDLQHMSIGESEKNLFRVVQRRIEEHDAAGSGAPIYGYIKTSNPHLPYGTPDDEHGGYIEGPNLLVNYRRTLRYIDDHFGELLEFLSRRERADRTVIVVTGDHANYLDQKETTSLPINDVVWTGLFIHGPEARIGRPRVVEEHASHVDLSATLLALVGDHRPTATVGRDLLGPARSSEATAVVVRPGGFRIDRAGHSLMIDRKRPAEPIYSGAFPGMPADDSPKIFGPKAARMLSEQVFTFSFLIENDRIWRPEFLAATESTLGLHREPVLGNHGGR